MANLTYDPPPLDKQILIRDSSERVNVDQDEIGREIEVPEWGNPHWANVRDTNPYVQYGDRELEMTERTVFTIRKIEEISPYSQVLFNGDIYEMRGKAVTRGGANAGLFQEYLELSCELVTV